MNSFKSIILIGPLGSGKDTILAALDKAFKNAMQPTMSYQVGSYYYKILSKQINESVQNILKLKGIHRTQLQAIGTTEEYVNQAIQFTIDLHNKMIDAGVIPIILGRLPREAIELQKLGAAVIFLESSEEERIERIWNRDLVRPTSVQIRHAVEPKLETFNSIADLTIYNNNEDGNITCNFDDYLGRLWFNNNKNSWSINLDV